MPEASATEIISQTFTVCRSRVFVVWRRSSICDMRFLSDRPSLPRRAAGLQGLPSGLAPWPVAAPCWPLASWFAPIGWSSPAARAWDAARRRGGLDVGPFAWMDETHPATAWADGV